MKLYYTSSVCSLAVRIIIHELGIDCTFESVNLKTKQTETGEDFFKINPKGTVPVLFTHENECFTENAIILQYLADKFNATQLLPPVGDSQRYRTLEWLNFVSTDLHRYSAPLFWSKIPGDVKENLFLPVFNNKLMIVERHLENNQFLMGNKLTLPDSYLFVILIWMLKLKMDMTKWPHLSRYFLAMKQYRSVKLSLEEECLESFEITL